MSRNKFKLLLALFLVLCAASPHALFGQVIITGTFRKVFSAPSGGSSPSCCSDNFAGTAGTALSIHNTAWSSGFTQGDTSDLQLGGGNTAVLNNASSYVFVGYAGSSGTISQMVLKATVDSTGVNKWVCVSMSSVGGNNYYCLESYGTGTGLDWFKSGGYAGHSGCTNYSASADHAVRIVRTDSGGVATLTAYVDGVECTGNPPYSDSSPLPAGLSGFGVGTSSSNVADTAMGPWQDH